DVGARGSVKIIRRTPAGALNVGPCCHLSLAKKSRPGRGSGIGAKRAPWPGTVACRNRTRASSRERARARVTRDGEISPRPAEALFLDEGRDRALDAAMVERLRLAELAFENEFHDQTLSRTIGEIEAIDVDAVFFVEL